MKLKYIFFDLDGTLTESGPGIINSVKYALNKMGERVPEYDTLVKFIGPSLTESFTELCGFSEEKTTTAIEYYREYFSTKGLFENSLYEGIAEMLKRVTDCGLTAVIATAKPEPFALRIADKYKLTEYIKRVCGSSMDERSMTKADVIRAALAAEGITDLSQVVMVGDRLYDVQGAHECGLECVGVLYGYGSESELREAGADYIAETVEDLTAFLENSTAR